MRIVTSVLLLAFSLQSRNISKPHLAPFFDRIDDGLACVQRQMVVWSTERPRSAISSSRTRRLRENRRYQRTLVTITAGSNWRFRNNGGRQASMT